MAKRKADEDVSSPRSTKKQAVEASSLPDPRDQFRNGLFDESALADQKERYDNSEPYKHGVIPDLVSPILLRDVRTEIEKNLSFTPKETDIYKIHQSGDLANLDGLDDDSLKLLPAVRSLREALYSSDFREYLSTVTGSGPLSGRKTDMAINVYTPGCHLLCHDDVIGSRRVSYILYLTDPDIPWKKEWGGALRLYPTQTHAEEDGQKTKVPSPDFTVSIPPAFNQLSFFAVQPGESFHDVEEVYASQTEKDDKEAKEDRVRMAISGWYHIPQEGEEGYVEGLEEQLAEKSSLMQLQGKGDKFDLPEADARNYSSAIQSDGTTSLPTPSSQEELSLSEEDLDFLLKYIAPTYLTPDTLESISSIFADECSLCLDTFLSHKFADRLKDYILSQESATLPIKSEDIGSETSWTVARPPHKHRFLYQRQSKDTTDDTTDSPIQNILNDLIPSIAFRKWLQIATGQTIKSYDSLARRFRKGHDYTLAQSYNEETPGIELCLSITPTTGWGDDQPLETADSDEPGSEPKESVDKKDGEAHDHPDLQDKITEASDPEVGGYLAYMAGDDDELDTTSEAGGSDHGIKAPLDKSTGARSTRAKKPKADPAIYQEQSDEDDGVLFCMPAGWNKLGLVLRDRGTMRFVKYVSRQAKGDRWDLFGEFGVEEREDGDDDDDGNDDDDGDDGNNDGIKTIEEGQSSTGDEADDTDSDSDESD